LSSSSPYIARNIAKPNHDGSIIGSVISKEDCHCPSLTIETISTNNNNNNTDDEDVSASPTSMDCASFVKGGGGDVGRRGTMERGMGATSGAKADAEGIIIC
jgi:hypothetical protein